MACGHIPSSPSYTCNNSWNRRAERRFSSSALKMWDTHTPFHTLSQAAEKLSSTESIQRTSDQILLCNKNRNWEETPPNPPPPSDGRLSLGASLVASNDCRLRPTVSQHLNEVYTHLRGSTKFPTGMRTRQGMLEVPTGLSFETRT